MLFARGCVGTGGGMFCVGVRRWTTWGFLGPRGGVMALGWFSPPPAWEIMGAVYWGWAGVDGAGEAEDEVACTATPLHASPQVGCRL